ncbi:MAG: hypothetical protein MUF72_00930 [Elainella sp. Prado103]|jgi:hypothetical protein|nr:hypothetical protein [Elainella sp. Prado103]
MNRDQQIQQLMDQAPQYGSSAGEVQIVAPVLRQFADRLRQDEYYIVQNLDQQWVMTTLEHRSQPHLRKRVVYAYASLEAVKANHTVIDLQTLALPLPTIQILFQLLALKPIDSLIFVESMDQSSCIEVSRAVLMQALEQHLEQIRPIRLPDNIA